MKTRLLICLLLYFSVGSVFGQGANESLKELIESAFRHSQKIKNTEVEILKAQIDKKRAFSGYLPQVSTELTYTHLNSDVLLPEDLVTLLMATQKLLAKEQLGLPFNAELPAQVPLKEVSPIQSQEILKMNVSANMVLFSGLKIPYSIKAVNHQIAMNQHLNLQEKSLIVKDILNHYDKLAVINQSEMVLEKTQDYLNHQDLFVRRAFENGLATDLEVMKIELAQQELIAKRIELQSSKKLLNAKLNQLSGVDIMKIEKMNPELKSFPLIDSIFSIGQRNDLQALDEAILATDYKRKIEYTEYVPKVFAFGKKELRDNDLSTFDPEWYVGVGVRWTIFDRMDAHRNAQKAKLNGIILENKRDEAQELLNLNLERTQLNLDKNIQLETVAKKKLEISNKAYNLSKKQFENGLITLTEHMESANDVEKAELELINAIYNQRAAVIELYEASGKLYETAVKILDIEL